MPFNSQTFRIITTEILASGSYTVPSGCYQLGLFGIGPGGGGGGGSTAAGGGGGGGGSGTGFRVTIPVLPGDVFNITIGAFGVGGAVNTVGTAGGTLAIAMPRQIIGLPNPFITSGGFPGSPGTATNGGAGGQGGGGAPSAPAGGAGAGAAGNTSIVNLGDIVRFSVSGGSGGAPNFSGGNAGNSATIAMNPFISGGTPTATLGGGGSVPATILGYGGAGGNASVTGLAPTVGYGGGGGGGGGNAAGGNGGAAYLLITSYSTY